MQKQSKTYVCPHCNKILAIGNLQGVIKCKKCGEFIEL
jgi:ribosomal protein L37AE/L43A